MTISGPNVELGRKIFGLRDAVNDKVYAAVVSAIRENDLSLSEADALKIVRHCQAEVTKLFDGAVDQLIK